jgi:5-methyltetrahydrofolate--homocysteine methyltransferase
MAFDEQGQADTVERKVAICERAYRILTEEGGFDPEDIVFDPNVLAVATGIEEHDGYAKAFIEALPLIKERCPARAPRAASRTSASRFRGNDVVREAMHAAFLFHAIRPASTWASSTRASSPSTRTSSPSCSSTSRT